MMILKWRRPVHQSRRPGRDFIHFLARRYILWGVGAHRVVRNLVAPWMRLGLRMNGLGARHRLSPPLGGQGLRRSYPPPAERAAWDSCPFIRHSVTWPGQ